MAWSTSKVFAATLTDWFNNTTAMDLNTDASIKAALFDNSITPSATVASASTAFGAGVWASGQVFDGAEWATGGVALSGVTSTFSSNVYTFTASNTASGSSATLASVFGTLVYDDTIAAPVADQGICFNYFGGTNSVTDGTFTIIWNASGIWNATV
jgi:hypothetical protein